MASFVVVVVVGFCLFFVVFLGGLGEGGFVGMFLKKNFLWKICNVNVL